MTTAEELLGLIKKFPAIRDLPVGSNERAIGLIQAEQIAARCWIELAPFAAGHLGPPQTPVSGCMHTLWVIMKKLAEVIEKEGIWSQLGITKAELNLQRWNWTLDD